MEPVFLLLMILGLLCPTNSQSSARYCFFNQTDRGSSLKSVFGRTLVKFNSGYNFVWVGTPAEDVRVQVYEDTGGTEPLNRLIVTRSTLTSGDDAKRADLVAQCNDTSIVEFDECQMWVDDAGRNTTLTFVARSTDNCPIDASLPTSLSMQSRVCWFGATNGSLTSDNGEYVLWAVDSRGNPYYYNYDYSDPKYLWVGAAAAGAWAQWTVSTKVIPGEADAWCNGSGATLADTLADCDQWYDNSTGEVVLNADIGFYDSECPFMSTDICIYNSRFESNNGDVDFFKDETLGGYRTWKRELGAVDLYFG
jgi:hypothetical protein